MAINVPAAVATRTTLAARSTSAVNKERLETILTVLLTATAVLFVSFIAVVTGLV